MNASMKFALIAMVAALPAWAQTVDEVIQLHEAGLSEATIRTQIEVTGTVYALENAHLIKLKKAGVPETLIQAMIKTASGVTATVEETSTVATSAPSASRADAQAAQLRSSLDTYSNVYGTYPGSYPYYPGYAPRLGIFGSYYGYPYHGYYGYYGYHRYYGYPYGYRRAAIYPRFGVSTVHRGHHHRHYYRGGLGFVYKGSNFRLFFRR